MLAPANLKGKRGKKEVRMVHYGGTEKDGDGERDRGRGKTKKYTKLNRTEENGEGRVEKKRQRGRVN